MLVQSIFVQLARKSRFGRRVSSSIIQWYLFEVVSDVGRWSRRCLFFCRRKVDTMKL